MHHPNKIYCFLMLNVNFRQYCQFERYNPRHKVDIYLLTYIYPCVDEVSLGNCVSEKLHAQHSGGIKPRGGVECLLNILKLYY